MSTNIIRTEGLAKLLRHKPPLEVWLLQSVKSYLIQRIEDLARCLSSLSTSHHPTGVVVPVPDRLFRVRTEHLAKHKPPLEVYLSQFVINY